MSRNSSVATQVLAIFSTPCWWLCKVWLQLALLVVTKIKFTQKAQGLAIFSAPLIFLSFSLSTADSSNKLLPLQPEDLTTIRNPLIL